MTAAGTGGRIQERLSTLLGAEDVLTGAAAFRHAGHTAQAMPSAPTAATMQPWVCKLAFPVPNSSIMPDRNAITKNTRA